MSREPATLLILAGGEAKRLGFPKHQLIVDGRRVIDTLHERLSPRFAETIIVGREIVALPRDVRLIRDLYHIRSPLVGIHAGLTASTNDLAFVVACDMPSVEPALVEYLLSQAEGFDVVVPVVHGYHEPLCAAYRRTCIPAIVKMLRARDLKVSDLYPSVQTREIAEDEVCRFDPTRRTFSNLNTPHRSATPAGRHQL